MADLPLRLSIWTQRTVAAGLGLLASLATAHASPDWELVDLRTQLTALSAKLAADGPSRNHDADTIVEMIDWPVPKTKIGQVPAFVEPDETAQISWTDLRFALVPLAQAYGGKDNFDIMTVTGVKGHQAVSIDSGVATLSQLRRRFTARQLGRDRDSGADLLRVPVIVAEGATLRLGPEDVLHMAREDGAFIINFGRLEIFGSEISSTLREDPKSDLFVPFIATVGSGSVHASGATIKQLGFGNTAKFSGFSVVAYPTMRPAGRTIIENTRFDDLVTLAMVGVVNAELRGNRFFDMRRNPLLVSRSQNADVAGNIFSGDSPTNAVRIWNGSDGARLIGNVILEGTQAGLVVGSGSDDVAVEGNLIWRRDGGGVKLTDTICGSVAANLILDDKQKGVEVRSSAQASVRDNAIIGNRNAGVWVSAQAPDAMTYVTGNLLRENGSGLTLANGAGVAMYQNDFSDQFPRLLDGDITQEFRSIVADLHGTKPILMQASGVEPARALTPDGCSR